MLCIKGPLPILESLSAIAEINLCFGDDPKMQVPLKYIQPGVLKCHAPPSSEHGFVELSL